MPSKVPNIVNCGVKKKLCDGMYVSDWNDPFHVELAEQCKHCPSRMKKFQGKKRGR